ncbi:hypothetical protein CCDG5_1997 [[Clostridium] cellulosi]|uniref:Uncharacterized protein n=1 Tax=[Clostridium] cellulosi TaxID=29343 RepID=A0A078KVB1_9FIRM|nr:hypothetical protein CCDG5_1997 [[Clostridium] cellulosi]
MRDHSMVKGMGEFQSTLPCGERPKPEGHTWESFANFNPRSRVGSDFMQAIDLEAKFISIHAPVWGATG